MPAGNQVLTVSLVFEFVPALIRGKFLEISELDPAVTDGKAGWGVVLQMVNQGG